MTELEYIHTGGDPRGWSVTAARNFTGIANPSADGVTATGSCPRCGHPMQTSLTDTVYRNVAPGGGTADTGVAMVCGCRTDHPGHPEGESGCGAWWSLRYEISETGVAFHSVSIAELDADAVRADAHALRSAGEGELTAVRSAASSWSKGIGAAVIALLGFGLVTGPSDISDLTCAASIVVGVLLAAALVAGMVSVGLLFRSAYGALEPVATPQDSPPGQNAVALSDHTEAVARLRGLRWGLITAGVGVTMLIAAVGVTWYGPAPQDPVLRIVDRTGVAWCGEVQATDDGTVALDAGGTTVTVNLDGAKQIQVLGVCPATG
ncbi:hypothetical protein GYA93_10710 [Gordonia desulfuricans]|uniref:Uncharacterized protein n=1 Tax=Gordonia desulfuricans TaxID=89051 RepID=A0A7K3LPC1_9ACTN|nr:hypothetical protein [Gordonia desulfuricans]NDK90048.1 hypothetical protein [Gordonia desulfuricans]